MQQLLLNLSPARISRQTLSCFLSHSRRSIVTQISPTTSLLRSEEYDNEVYLIGTAHISNESAKEVKDLIHIVRPELVFIELDPARAARLRQTEGSNSNHNMQNDGDIFEQTMNNMVQQMKSGGAFGNNPMFQQMMSGGGGEDTIKSTITGFYNLLRKFGYLPGVEMLAAMKEADKLGSEIYYGDVDMNETLTGLKGAVTNPMMLMSAMMKNPPPYELQRIFQDALFSSNPNNNTVDGGGMATNIVESIKTREYATLMTSWMKDALPQVANVMINKRDRIMAERLIRDCSKAKKVVAVVGMAHVDGIEREWRNYKHKLKLK